MPLSPNFEKIGYVMVIQKILLNLAQNGRDIMKNILRGFYKYVIFAIIVNIDQETLENNVKSATR